MRYPDPKNYDCPDDYYDAIDDYYDAIEMYEEMQKREKYGYDAEEMEENEDIDYDKEADRYFSERSNSFEYGKYK